MKAAELSKRYPYKIPGDMLETELTCPAVFETSSMAQYTNSELDWEKIYYPIIRLEWVNTDPSKPYVRIIEILQIRWPSPESLKATLSSTESN